MRYLTIPPSIPTKDLAQVSTDALSFHAFFLQLMLPAFPKKKPEHIQTIQDVATALEGVQHEGGVATLNDANHAALVEALPQVQGTLMLRLLPFYTAVLSASEKAPTAAPVPEDTDATQPAPGGAE